MKCQIVLLPGDGIGPEVTAAAESVLIEVGAQFDHTFEINKYLIGGCAIDELGEPLPEETLAACLAADAVLLGAVGGPKWDDPTALVRPEQGLLAVRKALGLFGNLRPVKPHPDLVAASPLRPERVQGVDLLLVRELTGGIYFGLPRSRQVVNGELEALDTMLYRESEIQRVAHLAFEMAKQRAGKVTSIDKANVLESSRLWRSTVNDVAKQYPEITLEHLLVDAAAMHLITRPATFDVIVTGNLFGDILSDEASVLVGSMGNLPSASIGDRRNSIGHRLGLYEPIHGSAPDIAGKGIANPIGAILSVAMLLRFSLGLWNEAAAVESSIQSVIARGFRTVDLASSGMPVSSTDELTAQIIKTLSHLEQVNLMS